MTVSIKRVESVEQLRARGQMEAGANANLEPLTSTAPRHRAVLLCCPAYNAAPRIFSSFGQPTAGR